MNSPLADRLRDLSTRLDGEYGFTQQDVCDLMRVAELVDAIQDAADSPDERF
jgi:hypothetical protein